MRNTARRTAASRPPSARKHPRDVLSAPIAAALSGETLVDCLTAARRPADEPAFFVEGLDHARVEVSQREFRHTSARAAAGLRRLGVGRRERVMVVLPTGADFLHVFWGTLIAGATPAPAYPPASPGQLATFADRLAYMAVTVQARVAVVPEALRTVLAGDRGRTIGGAALVTPEEVLGEADEAEECAGLAPAADDLALVQFSSGSTGDPRAICLTHRNVLSNVRAFAARFDMQPDDISVSWLPLYHDMGLIGTMIGTILTGTRLVMVSPLDFLRRPAFWLQVMGRYGATLSVAPQFAYNLCARKVRDDELTGVDLSPLRVILNGAEPIQAAGVAAFQKRFRPLGLRPAVVIPCYGLAEGTLAVTMRQPGQRLRRARIPAAEEAPPAVGVGWPMNDTEVRIRGEGGEWALDRVVGEICVRGASVCAGYMSPDGMAPAVDADGWLATGDLGFLERDELFVTGRLKDLVIVGGRNFYPQDLESEAALVAGLRPGRTVAFGVDDPQRATQALVLVAEMLDNTPAASLASSAAAELRRRLLARFGVNPHDIVLVPRGRIPLTTSGKLRRAQTRGDYERGGFSDAVYQARSSGA